MLLLPILCLLSISIAGGNGNQVCVNRPLGSVADAVRTVHAVPSCALPLDQLYLGLRRPLLGPPLDGKITPPWYNATMYKKGQKMMQKYIFPYFLGALATFPIFPILPTIGPILSAGGRHASSFTSNNRYLATMLQMNLWFEEKAESDPILESFTKVKGIHHSSRYNYSNWNVLLKEQRRSSHTPKFDKAMWAAIEKDLKQSKIPEKNRHWPKHIQALLNDERNFEGVQIMDQLSFAVTHWFLAAPVGFSEELGMKGTEEDWDGYNHLWAVIGYAIGLEDHFNVALKPSLKEVRSYYRSIYETYFLPGLFQIPDKEKEHVEEFYRGFIHIMFVAEPAENIISVPQFMLLLLENVHSIEFPNLRKTMQPFGRLLRNGLKYYKNAASYDFVIEALNAYTREIYFKRGGKQRLGVDSTNPQDVAENSYYNYNF